MDKKLVEGIIFDLDGTLIDYEGASHIAISAPLEKRGKCFDWDLHARIVGRKFEDWSKIVLDACELADSFSWSDYIDEYSHEMHELYPTIKAWPGTLELLRALKARSFPMAIATSSPRVSFDEKMKYHPEILELMDAVVTGDEVENGKPAPDIFLEAANRIGCAPDRCIVFEDSPFGIEGAQAAGCYTVALPDPRMPANAS